MQNKINPDTHSLAIALDQCLAQFFSPKKKSSNNQTAQSVSDLPLVLLGLSGGLDSVVLLHLLAKARHTLPFDLHAMHIHHGLNKNADQWAEYCLSICAKLNVPCTTERVSVDLNTGLGIEASARLVRYNALLSFSAASGAKFIFTAHHQDDQAETVLLKLARGAGVKGLTGITAFDAERRLFRPLLDTSRAALLEYANAHGLTWCEDDSNADTAFDRNYVRHAVMPILQARFPAIQGALARTASHMAEANVLLNDLAALDAEQCEDNNTLSTKHLSLLSHARAKNLLRWWFAKNALMMPTTEQLEGILMQCLHAKADANIEITLKALKLNNLLILKRYKDKVYLISPSTLLDYDLVWNGESILHLPDGSTLNFTEVIGDGLALKYGITRLRITNRKNGERFKPDANRPTRTLKHLLQEANMPPWARVQLPLIYWDDTLAYVPSIGIAHTLKAQANAPGLMVTWQPNSV